MLDDDGRAHVAVALDSLGLHPASWVPHVPTRRTYLIAACDGPPPAPALVQGLGVGRIDEPPAMVLEVVPAAPRMVGALAHALAGPGGLAGLLDVCAFENGLIVEVDPRRTVLSLLVDLIDIELRNAPGRTITPLFGLDDDALTAFAGEVLATPEIDRSRLVETYAEALLQEPSTCI